MQRHPTIAPQPTAIPADTPVTWTGGRPEDEEALEVWEILTREHIARHAALVARLGERLFRRDLSTLGAVADIGFFRAFYLARARALVASLDGTLLRVGPQAAA